MNTGSYNLISTDHDEEISIRLGKSKKSLYNQKDTLENIGNLLGDTKDMLNNGVENLHGQHDKISITKYHAQEIETRLYRGNKLADLLINHDRYTKILLLSLII